MAVEAVTKAERKELRRLAWTAYDRVYHHVTYYQAFDGAWVQFGSPYEHAVVVAGVQGNQVWVLDPIRGPGWWDKSTFEATYATFNYMAVVIT